MNKLRKVLILTAFLACGVTAQISADTEIGSKDNILSGYGGVISYKLYLVGDYYKLNGVYYSKSPMSLRLWATATGAHIFPRDLADHSAHFNVNVGGITHGFNIPLSSNTITTDQTFDFQLPSGTVSPKVSITQDSQQLYNATLSPWVIDPTAPVVGSIPDDGYYTSGFTLDLNTLLSDTGTGVNFASSTIFVDGVDKGDIATIGTGNHVLKIAAYDNTGNSTIVQRGYFIKKTTDTDQEQLWKNTYPINGAETWKYWLYLTGSYFKAADNKIWVKDTANLRLMALEVGGLPAAWDYLVTIGTTGKGIIDYAPAGNPLGITDKAVSYTLTGGTITPAITLHTDSIFVSPQTYNATASQFYSDVTAPAITLPANTGFHLPSLATISASATDVVSVSNPGSGLNTSTWQYSVNSGAWTNGSSYTPPASGMYTLQFRVTDNVGNVGTSDAVTYDFMLPTLAPSPVPPAVVKQGYTVVFSASDVSGFDSSAWDYLVLDQNGNPSSATVTVNKTFGNPATMGVTISSSAKVTIKATVKDIFGNTTSYTTGLITFDAEGPTIVPVSPPVPTAVKSNQYIRFSATDAGGSSVDNSGWSVVVNSGDAANVTGEWDSAAQNFRVYFAPPVWLPNADIDGAYSFQVKAKDAVGNEALSSAFSVTVDNKPPAFDMTPPPFAGTSATVSLSNTSGTGTAIASRTYTFNGQTVAFTGNSFTLSGDGAMPFSVTLTDAAGNATTKTGSITFDTVAPTLTLSPITVIDNARYVTATVTDSGSGFDLVSQNNRSASVSNGAGLPMAYNGLQLPLLPSPAPAQGAIAFRIPVELAGDSVTVSATVKDQANNPVSGSRVFDIAGPQVSFSNATPLSGGVWYVNAPLTYAKLITAVSAIDPAGVDSSTWTFTILKIGENLVTIDDENESYSFEGIATLTAYVKDSNGNQGSAVQTLIYDASIASWDWDNGTEETSSYLKPSVVASVETDIPADANQWTALSDRLVVTADPSGLTLTPSLVNAGTRLHINAQGPGTAGEYAVTIKQRDKAENLSNALNWHIYFDDQAPTLGSVVQFDGLADPLTAEPLGPLDFLTSTSSRLTVIAADNYPASGYSYQVLVNITGLYPAISAWPSDWTAAAQYTDFSGLSSGSTNYFYIRIKDGAGNISSTYERAVRVNDQRPAAPTVVSTTHTRANRASDASAWTSARFRLSTSYTGPAGLKEFKWRLLKGYDRSTAGPVNPAVEGTTLNELTISGLADNEENEFYYLAARSVGGNAKESDESYYPFRVDTTPPAGLVVQSSTHPLSDFYYNARPIVFEWNQPSDFSGVLQYGYRVYDSAAAPEEAPASTTGFTVTDARFVNVAVSGDDGSKTIWVFAEDYAGNKKWASAHANFDLLAPAFPSYGTDPSGESSWYVTANAAGRSATLTWQAPTDNITASADVVVGVLLRKFQNNALVDVSHWTYLRDADSGGVHELDWEGLVPDAIYVATIRLSDDAGNQAELAPRFFKLDGTAVDIVTYAETFSESVAGFTVEGSETFVNGVRQSGAASIATRPSDFLKPATAAGIGFDTFDRENRAWSSGESSSAWNWHDDLREAHGNGLVLSAPDMGGLSLSGLSTDLPVQPESGTSSGSQTTAIVFNHVSVGPAPYFYWQSQQTVLPDPYKITTTYPTASGSSTAWSIRSMKAFSLEGNSWVATDGALWNAQGLGFEVWFKNDPAAIPSLRLGKAVFAGSSTVKAAISEDSFMLRASDNLFEVQRKPSLASSAELLESRLLVHEAQLLFTTATGQKIPIATLSDFMVDTAGRLYQGGSFNASVINQSIQTPYGELHIDQLQIVDGTVRISEGTITRADGNVITLADFGLSEGGLADGNISGTFEHNYHGFKVTAQNGRVTNGVRVFATAKVEMPAYGVANYSIANLGVALADDSIRQNGKGSASTPITSTYGGGTWAKDIELSAVNLSANISVDLPASWGGSRLDGGVYQLKSSGEIVSLSPSGISVNTATSQYQIAVQGLDFVGGGAQLAGIDATLSAAFNLATYHFQNTVVKIDGSVTQSGHGTVAAGFKAGVWDFNFESLDWGSSGPQGTPAVTMPAPLGGSRVLLGLTTLAPDGSFVMSNTASEFSIDVYGWSSLASQLRLDAENLVLSNVSVTLPGIMDGADITVGEVQIKYDGQFVSSGKSGTSTFRATNGFKVQGSDVQFTPQGLRMGGTVYVPDSLGGAGVSFPDQSLSLASDGAILTPDIASVASGGRDISIAGWSVHVTSLWFDRRGLTIASSSIKPLGLATINLPEFVLYPSGEFLVDGKGVEDFEFDLLGGLSAGIRGIRFNDAGLTMSAYVNFPEGWGASAIYFEDLTLHPDGSITSNLAIPHFEFVSDQLGLNVSLNDIRLDPEGFSISSGDFTFTRGELEGKGFGFRNFSIKNDGSLEVGNIVSEPLQLWGYEVGLTSFALRTTQHELSIGGYVTLASDFPIAELAGKVIDLETFTIGFDGTVKEFKVKLNGELRFPIYDSWYVSVADIEISKKLLKVAYGKLELPPELGVDSVVVNNIQLDLETGEFTIGDIDLNNVSFDIEGIEFLITKLSISKNDGLIFAGSVTVPENSPEGTPYPEVIRNKSLVVQKLQIKPDFTIGDISASIEGLAGPLFSDDLILQGGVLGIASEAGHISFRIGGSVTFGPNFPSGLAGRAIAIHALSVDITSGELKELDIGIETNGNPISIDLFNAATLEIARLGIAKGTEPGVLEVYVGGAFVLGNLFPDALKGKKVTVHDFRIDTNGQVLAFDADFTMPGSTELFAGLFLKDAKIAAVLKQAGTQRSMVFGVSGAVVFGSSFPDGIAGSQIAIHTFEWSAQGNILNVDIAANFPPDLTLFNALKFRNASIGISKRADSNTVYIGITGTVVLPSALPEGLANLEIPIRAFKFATTGTIEQIDIGFSGLNVSLFGVANLVNTSLQVSNNYGNDKNVLLFTVSGGIKLPTSLPGGLSGLTVTIKKLQFTSTGTLVELSGGLASSASFELFAGLKLNISSFNFDKTGMDVSAILRFPDGMLEGLPRELVLQKLSLGWDGTLREIAGGISAATIKLAGFTTTINNLIVYKDKITIGKAVLKLPDNMGGQEFTLSNAGYNFGGQFTGVISTNEIKIGYSGFELIFRDPSFDFTSRVLAVRQAVAKTPAFVGGTEVTMYGAKIKPDGLELGGVRVDLPAFSLGNGLGFRNCFVGFQKDGNDFRIEGGGEATIPGAGTLTVKIAFRNISEVYPIGLEYAYFSFEIAGMGLQIGTTPVYLNAIRGGIAFGPPNEIPDWARRYFADRGIRLQLGLTLSAGNPSLLKGTVDTWIDVQNWSFAFKGGVYVLDGFAYGEIRAAIGNGKGFYAGFFFSIKFIRGSAEIWVFPYQGRVLVNGSAAVQIGLPRGSLINTHFLFWDVVVPDSDWWGPQIGADFGTFTNGRVGAKGWISLPVVGTLSAFVDKNGFTTDNVNSYQLVKP